MAAAIPVLGGLGMFAAASAGLGVTLGGPGAEWWIGGRLIPLLLPTAGIFGGLLFTLRKMKRANRADLAEAKDYPTLTEPEINALLATPSTSRGSVVHEKRERSY